jgi:hypothetical protein
MVMTAKNAAMVLGIIFIIVGALGFAPTNPIVGPDGIFVTNATHNWIHIGSGIVLLIGAYSALTPSLALKIIGVVYGIVAVLGFILPMNDGMMLGMVAMNMADKWLHLVLAIVLLYGGFGLAGETKAATA